MLKIIAISDTHGYKPKLPTGDILVHAGDWSGSGSEKETKDFIEWLDVVGQNFKAVVVCPGNHDRFCFGTPVLAKKMFEDAGIIYLEDEAATVMDLKFYGMPWTPIFGRWAYMADAKGRQIRCDAIPDGIDVLVTHGPPYGIMDEVQDMYASKIRNTGCYEILKAVDRVKPKIQICGHIHEGSGLHIRGTTLIINASIMDEQYRPVNTPKILYL